MAALRTLWAGMLTGTSEDAETDSSIVLIMNERGGKPDLLHHTFPDTAQRDQEAGQANVYEITEKDIRGPLNESPLFSADQLNDSSIRVGIRGVDAWRPEAFFVWGEQDDGLIMPLALTSDLDRPIVGHVLNGIVLSTDASRGKTSFALKRVRRGTASQRLQRLILLLVTADKENAGTDDKIELQIVTSTGRLVVNHIFPDTSQDDLERGQANLYIVPLDNEFDTPFSREELNDDSIRLRIIGREDQWLPQRLFLFGTEDVGQPDFVVPLVHLPVWPFGPMSTDSEEGEKFVKLPLVPGLSGPPTITKSD
jgi:hypothetical protein